MAKTLYEKLFDAHVVYEAENETRCYISTVIWYMK